MGTRLLIVCGLVWACGQSPIQPGTILSDSVCVNAAIRADMTADFKAWDGDTAVFHRFGVTHGWIDGRDPFLNVMTTAGRSNGGHTRYVNGFRLYRFKAVDGGWQLFDTKDFPTMCHYRRAFRPGLPPCP